MLDIRDQPLSVGDQVYFLEFRSGSLHKKRATIVGFTPSNVRIEYERYAGHMERKLTQPSKYIVKI